MTLPLTRVSATACVAVLLFGCGHSEGFENVVTPLGPDGNGADVRLTLNSEQDYWPAWTEDGRGILYSFVDVVPGPQHRCIGLLAPIGGTRLWQLCDNRANQADSVNSFPAYALGADGRLLYLEAVAPRGVQGTAPAETTLWLADSAAPFQRRALMKLPGFAGATPVAWLASLTWTGPDTFIALAEDFSILAHCKNCGPVDSIFNSLAVVRGTITASGATLAVVPGTTGASGYSFAESGASIVFTLRDDRRLLKVPAAGGSPVAVAVATPNGGDQLLGVSCKGSTCVVAVDPVTLSTATSTGVIFGVLNPGANVLRAVSLTTGFSQVIRSGSSLFATPIISPVSGDVIAQVGGLFGYLQTSTTSGSDLHLYQGILP